MAYRNPAMSTSGLPARTLFTPTCTPKKHPIHTLRSTFDHDTSSSDDEEVGQASRLPPSSRATGGMRRTGAAFLAAPKRGRSPSSAGLVQIRAQSAPGSDFVKAAVFVQPGGQPSAQAHRIGPAGPLTPLSINRTQFVHAPATPGSTVKTQLTPRSPLYAATMSTVPATRRTVSFAPLPHPVVTAVTLPAPPLEVTQIAMKPLPSSLPLTTRLGAPSRAPSCGDATMECVYCATAWASCHAAAPIAPDDPAFDALQFFADRLAATSGKGAGIRLACGGTAAGQRVQLAQQSHALTARCAMATLPPTLHATVTPRLLPRMVLHTDGSVSYWCRCDARVYQLLWCPQCLPMLAVVGVEVIAAGSAALPSLGSVILFTSP
jgi:hypothetical protein